MIRVVAEGDAADLAYRFKARQVGGEDVADREIEPRRSKLQVPLGAAARENGGMTFILQHRANRIANQRVTIDDENASDGISFATIPASIFAR